MSALARLVAAFTHLSARWVPGAFTIACALTAVILVLGTTVGGASPAQVVDAWSGGVWALLTFGMQMALVVFTGYLVAVSPPARRALGWIAGLPRGPRSAVAMVAVVSMVVSWLHWGMGLITAAVLVAFVARRQPRADFRLLVASAYLGLGATWHAGLSGSVPLLLATPDNFLVKQGLLPDTVPLSETVFTTGNIVFVVVIVVVLASLAALLHPPDGQAVCLAPEDADRLVEAPALPARRPTPASWLEHTPFANLVVGGLGLAAVGMKFVHGGLSLDLNTLNLATLSLAIVLHWTPASLAAVARPAATPVHGILLQFPLYAGMFGVISGTSLAERFADLLVSVSSRGSFPVVVTWYSAVLNYFVPSGGSKWAIEAPYLLEAAARLGVDTPTVAMAYAFGDMGTNLIQPFWAIPLLAVARLEFREVLGFLAIFFLVYMAMVTGYVAIIL